MNTKTLVSGAVLAIAMAVAAPAFASSATSIAGSTISASDIGAVQTRCNDLQTEATTPTSLTEDSHFFSDYTHPKVNPLDQATSKIDLERLSLADCQIAGLVTSN